MCKCKSCGAQICWMKTTAGRSMPANMAPVNPADLGEKQTIIAQGGQLIVDGLQPEIPFPLAPETVQVLDPKTGGVYHGRIPHWTTCPDAAEHKMSDR